MLLARLLFIAISCTIISCTALEKFFLNIQISLTPLIYDDSFPFMITVGGMKAQIAQKIGVTDKKMSITFAGELLKDDAAVFSKLLLVNTNILQKIFVMTKEQPTASAKDLPTHSFGLRIYTFDKLHYYYIRVLNGMSVAGIKKTLEWTHSIPAAIQRLKRNDQILSDDDIVTEAEANESASLIVLLLDQENFHQ